MNKEQIRACVGAMQLAAADIDTVDYQTHTEFNLMLRTQGRYKAVVQLSPREAAIMRMVYDVIALADELKEIVGVSADGSTN